jgi:sulfite reductase (NADPH) hemoprotein beta-component
VAYHASDIVVSVVEPSIGGSVYSSRLDELTTQNVPGRSGVTPQVSTLRQNNDPLGYVLKIAVSGKLTSVTTTDAVLLPSIPHLYKLAVYPVVVHVFLQASKCPDFSPIAAVRNSGWIFLQSQTAQEAQDMAVTAHVLSQKCQRPVMHFFAGIGSSQYPENISIAAHDFATVSDMLDAKIIADYSQKPTTNLDLPLTSSPSNNYTEVSTIGSALPSDIVSQNATSVWHELFARTGRLYTPFQYHGSSGAKMCLIIFGSSALELSRAIDNDETLRDAIGIISITLYRPWLGQDLLTVLPQTVERLAVLEQIHTKTTKWGPILTDVLTTIRGWRKGIECVVGHQLGFIDSPDTARTAIHDIVINLKSAAPVQDTVVGKSLRDNDGSIQPLQITQPSFRGVCDSAYTNILNQILGDRLYMANALTSDNVGIPSSTRSSPEFGFGSLLARKEAQRDFILAVKEAITSASFDSEATRDCLAQWASMIIDHPSRADALAHEAVKHLEADDSVIAQNLLLQKQMFRKQSLWLIGSDNWAYDLGDSGIHHVLKSGQDVNMLIIDSTPYAPDSDLHNIRRKKDIGLYAMNFGNAYVASVAVYGSYTQVLRAIGEADTFNGPSIILAYLPTVNGNDTALQTLQQTKKSIDMGYWPLYRWHPHGTGLESPGLAFDSTNIKKELKDFLARDSSLSQLIAHTDKISVTRDAAGDIHKHQLHKAKDAYTTLMDGLSGISLTILYASDSGVAATVAKRLGARACGRGLRASVLAMDDYSVEELAREEYIVFVTSTAGQGEFPQNGRSLWDALKQAQSLDLGTLRYSVFGLGDSHYWPREEDHVYYNKPAKDLDRHLNSIGAQNMAGLGLGDDQDPDGYETGYRVWETSLWHELGVGGKTDMSGDTPPETNEDIKLRSNYLRGTIAEGLVDNTTGAISPSDQQLTKFHGTYMQDDRDIRQERKTQGLEPAFSFMIRCRLPGGVATPKQWLQMDEISTLLGNETMKLTTRQTFQFHGVIKSKLRPAIRAINQALMTTLAACGDVNRNVMCGSSPSQSLFHNEVYACSELISNHLLPSTMAYHEIWLSEDNAAGEGRKLQVAGDALQDFEPLYGPTYLPRKFKITIAIPPHNDTDVFAHDIGLIAIKGTDGHLAGFNMLVGGGMGVTHNNKKTYPQIGRMFGFVLAQDVHKACEHVMTVQRDHGDRQNRKHARLKYTLDDMGVQAFKTLVEQRWGQTFGLERPYFFEDNVDHFGWQRDEVGLHHYTLFIENGRVEDSPHSRLKTGLREIAKIHLGQFRLTANQHLIISNVGDTQLAKMKSLLREYGLDDLRASGLRLSSSACVAFPTCGLAMAESERYLPTLITKLEKCLEENGLRQDSIVMRMTGCPNGCARPWLAEVAFVGKAYGAYNMYLGGGYHGQRLNKLHLSSIKEDEILVVMKALLKRYSLERNIGERFGDFCVRVGIVQVTVDGRDFHDNVITA